MNTNGSHHPQQRRRAIDPGARRRFRAQAVSLLAQLEQNRQQLLDQNGGDDPVKQVSGVSAMEQAIAQTRAVIDALDDLDATPRDQSVRTRLSSLIEPMPPRSAAPIRESR